jgi:hypothetical protein
VVTWSSLLSWPVADTSRCHDRPRGWLVAGLKVQTKRARACDKRPVDGRIVDGAWQASFEVLQVRPSCSGVRGRLPRRSDLPAQPSNYQTRAIPGGKTTLNPEFSAMRDTLLPRMPGGGNITITFSPLPPRFAVPAILSIRYRPMHRETTHERSRAPVSRRHHRQ